MKEIKVMVGNELESIMVQNELFRLGYSWKSQQVSGQRPTPQYTKGRFLYAHSNGMLTVGGLDDSPEYLEHFRNAPHKEYVFSIGIVSFVEAEPNVEPTILLGGVEYTKRQLVEALNKFN